MFITKSTTNKQTKDMTYARVVEQLENFYLKKNKGKYLIYWPNTEKDIVCAFLLT